MVDEDYQAWFNEFVKHGSQKGHYFSAGNRGRSRQANGNDQLVGSHAHKSSHATFSSKTRSRVGLLDYEKWSRGPRRGLLLRKLCLEGCWDELDPPGQVGVCR